MNIRDLPQGSYKTINKPLNIRDLPLNSYKVVGEEPEDKSPLQGFGRVGNFLSETTGLKGTGEAIGGALFVGRAADKLTNKALEANKLVDEAKKLSTSDPKRRELLNQAMNLSAKSGAKAQDLIEKITTRTQAAGSMAKLGLTAATFLAPPAAVGLGLKGGLAAGAKIAEGSIIGSTFKALDNLEKGKPVGEGVGTA